MKRVFVILLVFIAGILIFTQLHNANAREPRLPKNIVLMVGDGMGVAQLTAGKYQKGELALEKFTTTGLITTHSGNSLVTDSAAAGTAMATGKKTNNRMISVDTNGKPIKTILEWAEELGMSTGVVVTCSVTDATPATFVAHVDNRFKQAEIAEQIAHSGIDVLFGGGWSYFIPASEKGSIRKDEKDLLADLKERMTVVRTLDEFGSLENDKPAAALLSSMHLADAKNRQPSLALLVHKALTILSKNEKGFFMLVEGAHIDWAGHDGDTDAVIEEVIDLDDAAKIVLNFALKDGETLIAVTADHETGGFALHQGSVEEKLITEGAFTSKNHTATMIPLFAFGPGSEVFSGIHDNTFIGETLINYVTKNSGN